MPAKSEKQARFFRLVKGVQSGNVSKSKVSKKVRDAAKSMSKKSVNDFTKLKEYIKGCITEIICEMDNPVVKNVESADNFDEFVEKPENQGVNFTDDELSTIDTIDIKPDEKSSNKISYNSTDSITGNNKQVIIIKKSTPKKVYIAICCPNRSPVNINNAGDLNSDVKKKKDRIIIKISKTYENDGDSSILYNFINYIIKEYNIK